MEWNRKCFSTLVLGLVLAAVLSSCVGSSPPAHPHIVFLVADDLGWNDIGFHNPDIISPNLNELARDGIVLNHSYVQPLCSPSRSAFMTSYYPFRLGTQHYVIEDDQDVCVPLNKTFLPQVLKKNDYATHMVGKWHLGFCKWECTPTYRGFDSFVGYYSSREDYYNKTAGNGYDFRLDLKVDWTATKNYSSYQYGDAVTKLIREHDTSKPMFLYFPIQSVHEPLEVPEHYYNMYPHIKTKGRRIFSGMVTALDDAVGRLVKSLKEKDMFNDTIIFFTADNGGWIPYHGNNYPLRGGKMTIWEGGTRVPGFVHYPKLTKTGVQYDGLMHAVDWFPTIVEAAGLTYSDPDSDGVSQWTSITTLTGSKRNELVYNLDHAPNPIEGRAAIRVGDYKLIEGYPGQWDDWYKPDKLWTGPVPPTGYIDEQQFHSLVPDSLKNFAALYNIKDDPYEKNNLYDDKPEIVKMLQSRLEYYVSKMVPANFPPRDPASNPKNYNGTWSPGWC